MSSRECQICSNSFPTSSFSLLSCSNHITRYCDECWRKHMKTEINDKGHPKLVCIECKRELQQKEIKQATSAADFGIWEAYTLNTFLQSLPDFRWCSKVNCGNGQIVDGGSSNSFFTCAKCASKTCFCHRIPWHSEMTCAQYNQWKESNGSNATEDYLASNTKPCPKCSFRIEKTEGCDHMQCSGCKYEFCWLCLADYDIIRKKGNHLHNASCQWYFAFDPV